MSDDEVQGPEAAGNCFVTIVSHQSDGAVGGGGWGGGREGGGLVGGGES